MNDLECDSRWVIHSLIHGTRSGHPSINKLTAAWHDHKIRNSENLLPYVP